MSLKFIIGRSGTGKTTHCLKEIAQKQSDKTKKLILIVPEQFYLQAEKDLINNIPSKGILSARVLTFKNLAYNILIEKGNGNLISIDDTSKSMALRKIVFDNESKLEYFKKSADKQGFMEQLSLTITELFQYNINSDKLSELISKSEPNSVIQMKLKDLKIIFDSYKNFLKNDYISSDEALDLLALKINDSNIIKDAEIWIDGFYGFTHQEFNVLEQILLNCKTLNVALTMDKSSFFKEHLSITAPFFEPFLTAQHLYDIAKKNNIKIDESIFLEKPIRFKTISLKHLEKYYFSYSTNVCNINDNLKIYSAENKYTEIENAACEILNLINNNNWRFRDIAVVTHSVNVYKKNIQSVFNEYKIPFFIDTKTEIISHPLVELIKSILAIVIYNYDYENVFRYLRTGFSELSRNEIDILENYVLAHGIKNYKWFESWTYGLNDEEEEKKINDIKDRFKKPIENFSKDLKLNEKYEVKEITFRIFQVLKDLDVINTLQVWTDNMTSIGNLQKASEHKQIWKIICEIFEKMVDILGNEKVTISDYTKIVNAGFEGSKMGITPPTLDSVIIGDIERTRFPNIKALFVLGVNEGILPCPSEINSIFSDVERENLETLGAELSVSGKRQAFEEQYLIYCGITKPSNFIYFSYSNGDLDGRAMRPSILISKIHKLFPLLKEENTNDYNLLKKAISPSALMHDIGNQLLFASRDGILSDEWKDVYSFYLENSNWNKKLEFIKDGIKNTNIETNLNKDSVKNLYNNSLYASVSRLEKFMNCPYSYFMQYAIKAKERKLYQLDTPDLGSLFHTILESFSHKLKKDNINWRDISSEEIENRIESAVDENAPKLGNKILLSTASHKYLIKRLKRISKRATLTLTEHIKRGNFTPCGFEIGFGQGEALPPIVIELSNGEKMFLNGKIDRIDVLDKDGNKYIKIIDYKSGTKSFSLQDIYYGIQLQLLIYMDALIKISGNTNLLPAGIFYFKISDPMVIKSISEMDTNEINQNLFKKLKMSGLVLNDKEIIKNMDTSLLYGSSNIIPVNYKTDGNLAAKGNSVADINSYKILMDYAIKKAHLIGNEILDGNITATPYKQNNFLSCEYCDYKSICSFDITNDKYRVFKKLNDNEVWDIIKEDNKNK